MKKKKMIGLVILIIGAVIFIFSLIAKNKIANAKGEAGTLTGFLPKNTMGNYVGGEIKGATEQYDALVEFLFIGGIILVVVGGGMTFMYRKH
jgi:hypothetical protein